ncbi:putative Ig domain-containing protein [Myxococcota bacterium]|nr:putative Ig domain-containing protein [Myxococcota bacterium]
MGSRLRLYWSLSLLFGVWWFPQIAEASHFRGGTLTYTQIGTTRQVTFTIEAYFRRSAFCTTTTSCVGQQFGLGTLSIANKAGNPAHSASLTVIGTVVSEDQSEDTVVFRWTSAAYTFPSQTTGTPAVPVVDYVAAWTGCCWIGVLQGPAGTSWDLRINVHLDGNSDPIIGSSTYYEWCVGIPFTQNVNASDPNNDPLTYDLFFKPAGMVIDPTGQISWPSPTAGTGDTYHVFSVRVTDSRGASTYRDYLMLVRTAANCNNKPPAVSVNPPSALVKPNVQTCATVTVTDPDAGQILRVGSILPPLTGATTNPSPIPNGPSPRTFTYCWTPTLADEGKVFKVVFEFKDNGTPNLSGQGTFEITVSAGGLPEFTITPPGEIKQVAQGGSISFDVKATDPDGNGINTFTFNAGLATFCTGTKVGSDLWKITCAPNATQTATNYNLLFTATDKDGIPKTATKTIQIRVVENRAPVVTAIPNQNIDEKKAWTYNVQASDPDGDTLTYSMSGLPAGATINPTTGQISWTPTQADVGTYTVTVTVSDGKGGTTTVTFTVTVRNVNDPPVITSTAPTTNATEDQPFSYKPTATDPDPGDQALLKWKLTKGPAGATIDPNTGEVKWTPGDDGVKNSPVDFEVEVCDPTGACVKQSWKTTVNNVNDAPAITSTPPTKAYVGQKLEYEAKATDADPSDTLTWKIKKAPQGATIDPATGKFEWTPANTDLNTEVEIEIEVCDSATPPSCKTQSFKLTPRQSCKIDLDCPTNLICVQMTDERVCLPAGCSTQSPKCATDKFCKDGNCDANACLVQTCAADTTCRASDGKCVKSCAGVSCFAGTYCDGGVCVPNPCGTTACAQGQTCDTSNPAKPACATDPCTDSATHCKHGRACWRGKCIDDPCDGMKCPDATDRCLAGQCIPRLPCHVDSECPNTQVCLSGRCYEPGCYVSTTTPKCPGANEVCYQSTCKPDPCKGSTAPTCAQGEFCRPTDGKCIKPCSSVACPAGQICRDGACEPDLCSGVTCAAGEACVKGKCQNDYCKDANACKSGRVCDATQGTCVDDPCDRIQCPEAQQVCRLGQCIAPPTCKFDKDCPGANLCVAGKCVVPACGATTPCPSGQVCVNGKCLEDPCANKQCPADQVCSGGNCVGSCSGVFCKQGEVCVNGQCTVDPCAGVQCAQGEVCYAGKCIKDPCKPDYCKEQRICAGDTCAADPCGGVKCPAGQTCKGGQCTGDLPCKTDVDCPSVGICIDRICSDPGCFRDGCSDGKLCIKAKCQDNPCANKQCGVDEFCRPIDGLCVKRCPTCATGKICVNGVCQDDPCASKQCNSGERCKNGQCVPEDPCKNGRLCKFQRACSEESCSEDPCAGLTCPNNGTCNAGVCVDPPKPPEPTVEPVAETTTEQAPEQIQPEESTMDADGGAKETGNTNDNAQGDNEGAGVIGGGCGCDQGTAASAPFFLFLLLLLPLARRRQRREAVERA